MAKNTDQYLKALKGLKKKWGGCIEFHAFLHDGAEHEHDLETDLIELEKSIITFYRQHRRRKIGKYTQKGMLCAVETLRATPPRQYHDTSLEYFGQIPHHPVVRELELVIADLEARKVKPLEIDGDTQEAIVDGKRVHLTDEELKILRGLKEKPGVWVQGKHLGCTRPDRIIKELNPRLGNRIKSSHDGYRLT